MGLEEEEAEPQSESQLYFPSSGIRKRKVYYKVAYTAEEQGWIGGLRAELERAGVGVPEKEVLLRFYYAADCDLPRAVEKLQGYHSWFSDPAIQAFREETRQVLAEGFVYYGGRARDQRPFMVMDLSAVDTSRHAKECYLQAINHVINRTVREETRPGALETYYFVADLKEQLLSLPIASLSGIVLQIMNVYSLLLERFFLVNTNTLTKWVYNRIAFLLAQDTLRKVTVATHHELIEQAVLADLIAPEQLEEKYGGSRSNVDHAAERGGGGEGRGEEGEGEEFFSIEDEEEYPYYGEGRCCAECLIY